MDATIALHRAGVVGTVTNLYLYIPVCLNHCTGSPFAAGKSQRRLYGPNPDTMYTPCTEQYLGPGFFRLSMPNDVDSRLPMC